MSSTGPCTCGQVRRPKKSWMYCGTTVLLGDAARARARATSRGARERGRALDRRVRPPRGCPAAQPSQRAHRVGRARQRLQRQRAERRPRRGRRRWTTSAAARRPRSAAAAAARPPARGRSPISARPTSAQAVRSPVPRPPYRWTTGRSACRAAGQLGQRDGELGRGTRPADQQLVGADRQGRSARRRPGSGSPHPAACERSSRRPWATGARRGLLAAGADSRGPAVDVPLGGDPVGGLLARRAARERAPGSTRRRCAGHDGGQTVEGRDEAPSRVTG